MALMGCSDCGVEKGELHKKECGQEVCPCCKGCLVYCRCYKYETHSGWIRGETGWYPPDELRIKCGDPEEERRSDRCEYGDCSEEDPKNIDPDFAEPLDEDRRNIDPDFKGEWDEDPGSINPDCAEESDKEEDKEDEDRWVE